jgi:hypothetical protein
LLVLYCLFIEKKRQKIGDNIVTREEEIKSIQAFIKKNGVTKLPPDQRGPEHLLSPWAKPKGRRGRRKKKTS